MVLADIDREKLLGEVNDLNHAGAFLHASVQVFSHSLLFEDTA